MDILLVEDDGRRRVAVARRLAGCGHRVTLSSSLAEAEEMLGYVDDRAGAPQAIIVAYRLLRRGGENFRHDLAARFPATSWIPMPNDLDPLWLVDWLEKVARRSREARRAASRRNSRSRPRQVRAALDVLLIEADDATRACMTAHMTAQGDRVRACETAGEARLALGEMLAAGQPPHAIVSPVPLADGDGLSFFLSARRRCPDMRWIVSGLSPAADLNSCDSGESVGRAIRPA